MSSLRSWKGLLAGYGLCEQTMHGEWSRVRYVQPHTIAHANANTPTHTCAHIQPHIRADSVTDIWSDISPDTL